MITECFLHQLLTCPCIGQAFWGDNLFRAVENGVTLFKCAHDGISGVADPFGRTLALKPMLLGDVWTAQIPIQPRVTTVYSRGGWAFGWVCLGMAPLYALLAAAGTKRVRERIPEKLRRAVELGKPERPLDQPQQLN